MEMVKRQGVQRLRLEDVGITRVAWQPFLIGLVLFLAVAMSAVAMTRPVWELLEIGRGLVPEELYPYSAFVMLVITTFGLFFAWGMGNFALLLVWHLIGRNRKMDPGKARLIAGLTYLVITFFLLGFIHFFSPIREGLGEWLAEHNPTAYGILFPWHTVVDYLPFFFAVGVFGFLFGYGDRIFQSRPAQAAVLFLLLSTFFTISLSLGFHSALVRIRIGL